MNETSVRHRGRFAQTFIYLGKQLRMFIFQNDWKVLPMSAVITSVVVFVVGANLYYTQEGTVTGAFALVCACIWNGFFNSIQSVCREREIVKREHRAGLHISAYIAAQMIYQFLLCLVQTLITLLVFRVAKVRIPVQGILTPWGVLDLGITLLLVTFTADMLAMMVSCLVRSTTTAMTVMPFLLIFQLVFSGVFFGLQGFAKKLEVLTISHWGADSLCSIGRYNEQPMVTLWNTVFKFKDVEIMGSKPLLDLIIKTEEEGYRDQFLLWSGTYNQNPEYAGTVENLLRCWGWLCGMLLVFVLVSILVLRAIDKDKR